MAYNERKLISFLSGGAAGLAVDMAMYPIDTIKTRMQSKKGFLRAGGIQGVYAGLSAVMAGSIPGASIFFVSYETAKIRLANHGFQQHHSQVIGASIGETLACLIRVPTEVIKQRAQVSEQRPGTVLNDTLAKEGFRGLYRGYFITVSREIPFCMIQYPLWEYLKATWASRKPDGKLKAQESSICGFIAGGTAAALTTPLDVAKTWIMLAKTNDPLAKGNILTALNNVRKERGVRGLFMGIAPRTIHIAVGGAIFLGVYDMVRGICLHFELY